MAERKFGCTHGRRSLAACLATLAVLGILAAPIALADPLTELLQLSAGDGAAEDHFGVSVATDGDYAIVGAYADDHGGNESVGSAYVYERSGGVWSQATKLTSSDGAAWDSFGFSVAISGDYAVVGASGDDDAGPSCGSIYVFQRTGSDWTEVAKLTALDGASGDYFGSSVSISGDYIVVGAYGNDDSGSYSGSAYVFERSGSDWTEVAKLTAPGAAANDSFGKEVAISGSTLVVGAQGDDDKGSSSGSVFVYERGTATWGLVSKLTAIDGASNDYFGQALSIDAGRLIVGAYGNSDNGSGSGSAYVFELSAGEWEEIAKLTAPDAAGGDNFGISVAIVGEYAVVGAYGHDDNGTDAGVAYLYQRNVLDEWVYVTTFSASDGADGDNFGESVDISHGYIVIGAMWHDGLTLLDPGAAYVFFAPEPATMTLMGLAALAVLRRRTKRRT